MILRSGSRLSVAQNSPALFRTLFSLERRGLTSSNVWGFKDVRGSLFLDVAGLFLIALQAKELKPLALES